jgi:hypothetical protein
MVYPDECTPAWTIFFGFSIELPQEEVKEKYPTI